MTIGDGPRSARPSEDVIRRRLIERRLAHQRRHDDQGSWLQRLFDSGRGSGPSSGREVPRLHAGRSGSLVSRLRRRPVAAFAAATVVAVLIVGGGAVALSMVDASMVGNHVEHVASARADRAGLASPRAGAATPLPVSRALRETTDDLPAAATGPRLSNETVAAALRLRLPSEDPQLTSEAEADPSPSASGAADATLTTGSILRSVGGQLAEQKRQALAIAAQDGGAGPQEVSALDQGSAEDNEDGEAPGATGPGPADPESADPESALPGSPDEDREAASAPAAAATVTASVNLRAGPDNDATILSVLRSGQSVELIGCDLWCRVTADGKTGYVYKAFVDRDG